jgi:DNA-binding MarR family transcriptional regulator
MADLPIVSPNRRLSGPLMEHLARRLRAESESEIERFGLRARHVVALTLLRDSGQRPQAELAGVLGLDPTNVVGLLNELETAGLIERRRSPQDRRRHTVALTAAGQDRLAAVEDVLITVERRALSALDDEQRAALHALLRTAIGDIGVDCSAELAEPCPGGS